MVSCELSAALQGRSARELLGSVAFALGFPAQGRQLVDSRLGVGRDSADDIAEVLEGLDAELAAALSQRKEDLGPLCTALAASEEEAVLSIQGDRAHRVFGPVVVDARLGYFDVTPEGFPLTVGVLHRSPKRLSLIHI